MRFHNPFSSRIIENYQQNELVKNYILVKFRPYFFLIYYGQLIRITAHIDRIEKVDSIINFIRKVRKITRSLKFHSLAEIYINNLTATF